MILAAREGQNKILKPGMSMNVEYFTVSQGVKVPEESLKSSVSPQKSSERLLCHFCFREMLIDISCFGFYLLPDLWGGCCGGELIFQ